MKNGDLDFADCFRKAESHVDFEMISDQLKNIKYKVYNEVNHAEESLSKIIEELPHEEVDKINIAFENLVYHLGRIKGYTK